MKRHVTSKDHIIWELLKDPNFRVTTCGRILTRLAPGCSVRTTRRWRPVGWVSCSRGGTKNYIRIRYQGVLLYAHRIVWAAHQGFLCPRRTINHKDLNGLNNAISNLELIDPGQNTRHALAIYRHTGLSAAEYKRNWIKGSGGGRNWRGIA